MNKRQRKKLYLKKTGKNPPSRIALRGESYNKVVGFTNKAKRPYFKPEIIFRIGEILWENCRKFIRSHEETDRVVNLTRILTKRRKVRRKW